MSFEEPSAEVLAKARATLKADIEWAIMSGPGWDPQRGGDWNGTRWNPLPDWRTNDSRKFCGVCAIGAHVVRAQVAPGIGEEDFEVAARSLGTPRDWTRELYYAVGAATDYLGGVEEDDGDQDGFCAYQREDGCHAPDSVNELAFELTMFAAETKRRKKAATP